MRNYAVILLLLQILLSSASAVNAETKKLDTIDDLVNQFKNSPEFARTMTCLGVSKKAKLEYLKKIEEDVRYCLTKFPKEKDGGAAFISCWVPKILVADKVLGVSESIMKKCKAEEDSLGAK